MNTATAVSTYVFGVVVVVLIGVVIRRMRRGWRHRAARQADLIGDLPAVPERPGRAVLPPMRGLYLGSAMAGDWLDRINVGDLGYRCAAVITGHAGGILLERSGTGPIWMPRESVTAVQARQAMAGKVIPGGDVLVVRWRLPSGTEIDTGFRGEGRPDYSHWTGDLP